MSVPGFDAFSLGLFQLFAVSILVSVALFGAIAVAGLKAAKVKTSAVTVVMLILGVSTLGACAGLCGGMSREPAVGAIIPALFTLLGGVVLYLFGIEKDKGSIASVASASIATTLVITYVAGAQIRNKNDELRDLRDHCIAAYTNADIVGKPKALAAFEVRFGNYCHSGLDWNLDAAHLAVAAGKP